MLATWATPQTRGKVYGFHRAMDHAGAVLGPALASVFLLFFPDRYRTLFALTIVPGAIAVALILLVKEETEANSAADIRLEPDGVDDTDSRTAARQELPRAFTMFMMVLTLFALGNSTDAFLLLKLTDVAGSAKYVPLMWAALHVVKATTSVVGGSWSDWLVYAVVYAGFAVSTTLEALVVWFLVYGFYFGFAEGTEKALVADLAPEARRGLAFGIYNAVQGIGALAASVVFGVLWSAYGPAVAFGVGAALALTATALLFAAVGRQP